MNLTDKLLIAIIILISVLLCLIIALLYKNERHKKAMIKLRKYINNKKSLNDEDFLTIYQKYRTHYNDFDLVGCYILHDLTNDKYYVGQSTHVPKRIYDHLNGNSGNPDVYFYYRSGHKFEITMIPLIGTRYLRLDDMERDLIKAYDSAKNGYNRSNGNR